jgi:hypothetical protein
MNEQQRQRLLRRTRRRSGLVGEDLPEEIDVQGTTVELNAFVFDCKRLDAVPDEERERIEEMETRLKRERLERRQRIERGDISYEDGERLVESIRGIERALNALEGIDSPSIEEEMRQKEIADADRLRTLIDRLP